MAGWKLRYGAPYLGLLEGTARRPRKRGAFHDMSTVASSAFSHINWAGHKESIVKPADWIRLARRASYWSGRVSRHDRLHHGVVKA